MGAASGLTPFGTVNIGGFPVINNLNAAQQYAVNLSSYEMIVQSLYDSASYPAAGTNQITFFQTPIGGGVGVISGVAKTPEDTNMLGAGQLPAMQAYIVSSIELDVQPDIAFTAAAMPAFYGTGATATSVNDVWKIRATGYLNFNIGSKSYLLEGPLMKFPASNDLEIDAALSDATTAAASQQSRIAYAKAVGPSYNVSPNNLLLIPNQNFNITLNWATLEVVTSAARIFARLMGQLLRAAQ
jgi:hypothetical protein